MKNSMYMYGQYFFDKYAELAQSMTSEVRQSVSPVQSSFYTSKRCTVVGGGVVLNSCTLSYIPHLTEGTANFNL